MEDNAPTRRQLRDAFERVPEASLPGLTTFWSRDPSPPIKVMDILNRWRRDHHKCPLVTHHVFTLDEILAFRDVTSSKGVMQFIERVTGGGDRVSIFLSFETPEDRQAKIDELNPEWIEYRKKQQGEVA